MGNIPELMTPSEVAEALKVNDETIHRWVREGRLPAIRLPGGGDRGLKRFRREDIEAILRGERSGTAA